MIDTDIGALRAVAAQKHQLKMATTRHFLIGKEYFTALAAMEFARSFHTGLRKDNVSPEFSHQIYQANYTRTLLSNLLYPEETLAVVFLHDVMEDYDVSEDELVRRFGTRIALSTLNMSKRIRGVDIPYPVYFGRLAQDPIGSIAKLVDRSHNYLTMADAGWGAEKQEGYVDDMYQHFIPMLKQARIAFAQQGPAYENIKTMLYAQIAHIQFGLEQMKARQSLEENQAHGMKFG